MGAEKQTIQVHKNPEESKLFESRFESADLGQPDSLRFNVLTWISEENYDKAIELLREFGEMSSPYPSFKRKTSRHIQHSISLVYAIKAKRSFSGVNSLTRTKQQELREKFRGHLRELRKSLQTLEKIQEKLIADDSKSTIYVIYAGWLSALAIAVVAFWLEVVNGLAKTSYIIFDDQFGRFVNWLAEKTGL
jgi:hypothetical protein